MMKRSTLESSEHNHKIKNSGQLGFIIDPYIIFQNYQNGLNDHKEPENINYTIVYYGETFF